jgi:hypothetical protein
LFEEEGQDENWILSTLLRIGSSWVISLFSEVTHPEMLFEHFSPVFG